MPKDMDHSNFDLEEDLTIPFKDFMKKLEEGLSERDYEKYRSGEPVDNSTEEATSLSSLRNFKRTKIMKEEREEAKNTQV